MTNRRRARIIARHYGFRLRTHGEVYRRIVDAILAAIEAR